MSPTLGPSPSTQYPAPSSPVLALAQCLLLITTKYYCYFYVEKFTLFISLLNCFSAWAWASGLMPRRRKIQEMSCKKDLVDISKYLYADCCGPHYTLQVNRHSSSMFPICHASGHVPRVSPCTGSLPPRGPAPDCTCQTHCLATNTCHC